MIKQTTNHMKPQYFNQKGYISNKFFVKSVPHNLLRFRKSHLTQIFKSDDHHIDSNQSQCPNQLSVTRSRLFMNSSEEISRQSKCQTKEDFKIQGIEKFNRTHLIQNRYEKLKTTKNRKNQLAFLRPYSRFNHNSQLTAEQQKQQIYKTINNPQISTYNEQFKDKIHVIEYLTTYKSNDLETNDKNDKKDNEKSIFQRKKNLHVLLSKLKKNSLHMMKNHIKKGNIQYH